MTVRKVIFLTFLTWGTAFEVVAQAVAVPSAVAGTGAETPAVPSKEAREAQQKAVQKGEILFDLMTINRKAGRIDRAIAFAKQVLELPLDPAAPETAKIAGKRLMVYADLSDMLLEKGQTDDAVANTELGMGRVEQLVGLPPEVKRTVQVELLKRSAKLFMKMEQPDKAEAALEKALTLLE